MAGDDSLAAVHVTVVQCRRCAVACAAVGVFGFGQVHGLVLIPVVLARWLLLLGRDRAGKGLLYCGVVDVAVVDVVVELVKH